MNVRWISLFCVLIFPILISACGCHQKTKLVTRAPITSAEREKAKAYQLEWNLKTLTAEYFQVGNTNPAWDEPARSLLDQFARMRVSSSNRTDAAQKTMVEACRKVREAGCTDPLVNYITLRFLEDRTATNLARKYLPLAKELRKSQYSDIRKFYACLRTAEYLKAELGFDVTNVTREVSVWRRNSGETLLKVAQDTNVPPAEIYDACHDYLMAVWNNNGSKEIIPTIEQHLLKNWPDEPLIHLFRGMFWTKYGWDARGGGWAHTVSPAQWKVFYQRLIKARQALETAWALDPLDSRIATEMLSVCLGQNAPREEMEKWFQRAMTLDPKNYEACTRKLYYLEPKWYGTPEDVIAFARECVQSTKWSGNIPLIMVDAHYNLAHYLETDAEKHRYYLDPAVWKDLKSAFERFFELNPTEIGYRHNYARYAYYCEQWTDLAAQIKLLGPINYAYFGGTNEFEKMCKLAAEHGKK